MKHLLLTLVSMVMIGVQTYGQNPNIVYATSRTPVQIDQPSQRTIAGGTIISVNYRGSGFSTVAKGAFEYACKLIEEQIPTTFPLRIIVEYGNLPDSNALAMVFPNFTSEDTYPYMVFDKVYVKRRAQNFEDFYGMSDSEGFSFFRDGHDFTIKFSRNHAFDYNINPTNINQNKYDFITVALQALIKGIGVACMSSCVEEQLYISSPSNKYSQMILTGNPTQDYIMATSDNVYIPTGYNTNSGWALECGIPYRQGISLSYLSDNNESACDIMQYGIAKGAYIRNLGSFLEYFFKYCEWDRPIPTGMNGTRISNVNTDDIINFQGLNASNVNTAVFSTLRTNTSDDDFGGYMDNRKEVGEQGSFVLLKDGSWRSFCRLQDLSDNSSYARTVDGYLRLKRTTRVPGVGDNYYNWDVKYQLYDYIPQIPEVSISSYSEMNNLSITDERRGFRNLNSLSIEDVFIEVEVEFKNIEGTSHILVEQTDSDYPYPYSYYVDDISTGSFTTFMNMRYPSTIQLTYINNNGETTSEPIVLDFTNEARLHDDSRNTLNVNGNLVFYALENSFNELKCVITNLNTGRVLSSKLLVSSNGIVDTSFLSNGLYSIAIYSYNNKIAELKWRKN